MLIMLHLVRMTKRLRARIRTIPYVYGMLKLEYSKKRIKVMHIL